MSDLKFNCPHCQQRLAIPAAAMGRTIPCPLCQGRIQLPAPREAQPEPQPESLPPSGGLRAIGAAVTRLPGDIKFACPSCEVRIVIAERAAGKHIACQRCGARILVPGAVTPPAPPPPPAPEKPAALSIPELIERVRGGDEQAGRALIQTGESVIPALVDGFREYALEEPDTNRGADHIANLLVRCGAVSVQPLIAKLGKSRHAYLTLGRIGSAEALQALTSELSSCNWRRVEVACQALGLAQTPSVLRVVDPLNRVLKSTRSGEVYAAAAAALDTLQRRFPEGAGPRSPSLPGMVATGRGSPLAVLAPR